MRRETLSKRLGKLSTSFDIFRHAKERWSPKLSKSAKLHWIYTTLLRTESSEEWRLSLVPTVSLLQSNLVRNVDIEWIEMIWRRESLADFDSAKRRFCSSDVDTTCRQCRLVTSSSAPKDASAILPGAWSTRHSRSLVKLQWIVLRLSSCRRKKNYFTTEPLSRQPISTIKVLFNPALFEAKFLQMSKIVLICF